VTVRQSWPLCFQNDDKGKERSVNQHENVAAEDAHRKKFMALALVSGGDPGGGLEIGDARAKWPLNIMGKE
jgi:hypothetical protein